ncbi:hypothetical protein ACL02T_02700 [Pseudonocardia sp. RS010]|uniref:hypothetical protein n=1 Tax=Pseudonocardia sp. RS010 TaxID=3385979 RepID=UPI00399F4208
MTGRPEDPTDPTRTEESVDPTRTEETVDRLEEEVVGHRVDQRRDEEEDPRPAHRQDVDPGGGATDGPGAEPSD